VSRSPTHSPQVFNGTNAAASSGGADVGIIAAGIAIPLILLALCACCVAAALLLYRRRKNKKSDPKPEAAVGAPSLNPMVISPLFPERTTLYRNELYDGGDPDVGGGFGQFDPPAGGPSRDDVFGRNTITWDSV
jgi:hypothetical protein